MNPRPFSITLLAVLLIVFGAIGLVYHFSELNPSHLLQNDALWVELVRILAIIAGIFLLRGRNWARWLALLWIGFHVVISFWHPWSQLAIHIAVFAVFAYFLFRPTATRYFGSSARPAT
jgi:hypothetical protein